MLCSEPQVEVNVTEELQTPKQKGRLPWHTFLLSIVSEAVFIFLCQRCTASLCFLMTTCTWLTFFIFWLMLKTSRYAVQKTAHLYSM